VQIAALRRVLGEEPGGDRWIETMPRRGYRFVGPVLTTEQDDAAVRSEPAPKSVESALALPDKPSIAVFVNSRMWTW
jgi:DNA-binding winged helix-turn-helix (wHTH) protein